MSAKNVENAEERKFSLGKQNDVGLVQCTASAETADGDGGNEIAAPATAPERTNASESRTTPAPIVPISATMVVDENDPASGNKLDIALAVSSTVGGGLAMSPGSGGGERADASPSGEKQGSDGSDKNNSKRKTRRGKTKRGKRSSSSRPYSKSQWKFHVPLLRTAANKRRAKVSLGSAGSGITKDPFLLSDQPPLVPYNTNRFLMEDHMPQVLTPSEDEEEFLTKEFSSVYEDARSERLEGLSKSQLIQEYLQLEANYEQVTRRYNAVKSLTIKEENESAVNNVTTTTATTKDATEGGPIVPAPVAADRRRLEDRIRDLTAENLELRRQLEHASRIGMVLSAKSSPRNYGASALVEQMDSSSCHGSSSEDSESDSSSSTSSSSSDNDGADNNDDSSSSSMSDDDDVQLVADGEWLPLVTMEDPDEMAIPMEANGYHHHHHRRRPEQHHQNGLLADDEEELSDGAEDGPVSPLSAHSINSPPPPPLAMN